MLACPDAVPGWLPLLLPGAAASPAHEDDLPATARAGHQDVLDAMIGLCHSSLPRLLHIATAYGSLEGYTVSQVADAFASLLCMPYLLRALPQTHWPVRLGP